jgi:hypothetical protein
VSALVPRPPDETAKRLGAKGVPPPAWMMLAPGAKMRLQPLFNRFGLDVSELKFSAGGAFGQYGITFGDTILLSRDFAQRSYTVQLGLLAHEITHA